MTQPGRILVTDDEEKIVRLLGRALKEDGYDVTESTCPRQSLRLLAESRFDIFAVDNVMPGLTGLEVVRELVRTTSPSNRPDVLLMTAHATLDAAVEALKLGVVDFLRKPFDVDEFLAVTARALHMRQAMRGTPATARPTPGGTNDVAVVGESAPVQELLRQVRLIAPSKSTVLILGETGTGKELLANAIHRNSPRRTRPFVKVNCAAIPANLLESELFGHVRGAFTGAVGPRRGKFALADGGTIFLDEVGTLSMSLQPKILRVLQEREFEPLGAERTERVDVRIVAATNRDLGRMVAEGRFLEDLYYRLSVIPIRVPPLRDRPTDIPLLVEHFRRKYEAETGKVITGIAPEAMQALLHYPWPGNVRELENTIERAVVLASGPVISPECISPPRAATPAETMPLPSLTLRSNVDWVERETVRRAIEATRGVKKDAAGLIGISQRALSYYITKHNLEPSTAALAGDGAATERRAASGDPT